MKQGKYIVMEIAGVFKRPFLFPAELNHADMAKILSDGGYGKPVSAGNVTFLDTIEGMRVDCHGFSVSLSIGPAEGDGQLIRNKFVEDYR
jgi:hypothetical protein